MFKLKNKYKIYKAYQEDIWGLLRLSQKLGKIMKHLNNHGKRYKKRKFVAFTFDITVPPPMRRRRRNSPKAKRDDYRKKLCFYYGGLRKMHYRNYGKVAYNMKGDFRDNFLSLLEMSLAFAVYRANFVRTIGESIQLVLGGKVLVNKEVIKRVRHSVQIGDIVEIAPMYKQKLFVNFMQRLYREEVLQINFNYIIVSYSTMSFMFYRKAQATAIMYPFSLPANFVVSDYFNRI